jgi:hypothetical protein
VIESVKNTIQRGFTALRKAGASDEIPINAEKLSRFSTMSVVIVGWAFKGVFLRTIQVEIVDAVKGTLRVTPYLSDLKEGEMLVWNGYTKEYQGPSRAKGGLDEQSAMRAMTSNFDKFRITYAEQVGHAFDPPYTFAFVGKDGSVRILKSQGCGKN